DWPMRFRESARWVWDTSTWGGQGEGYGTVPVGEGVRGSSVGKIYSEVHLGGKRG
nr:hypothetical protein [Tanacetum cinerariifolium]